MRKFLKVPAALVLFSLMSICYAIQVNVQSPSEGVYAVGFTVNGAQYGGPGKSYNQGGMPVGAAYAFGVRIGGLIIDAEDIPCTTVNGSNTTVTLNSDTHATLMYDGNKKCYVEIG